MAFTFFALATSLALISGSPVVFEAKEGYQGELFIVSKIYLENNCRGILSLIAYREDLANSLGKAVGRIIESK